MNSHPTSIRDINVNNVSFVPGLAKPGRNPGINFKHEGSNLSIRVPRINFPGGVLAREDEKTGVTSYTLIGSMKGCDPFGTEHAGDSEGDVGRFYNFLIDLDELIIQHAVTNSVKWFGKKRSEEAIRDTYKRIVSVSADKVDGQYKPNGKYPPSFRVKIPVYNNKVSTEIVDSSRNPIYVTPESLVSVFPKGVDVNMIIGGSIYIIAGGGFGVTWRLNSAQVIPRARITARDIFADENDVEDSQQPPTESATVPESQENIEIPDETHQTTAPPAPAPRKPRRVAAGAL